MGTRFPAEFHGLCQAEVHFAMGTFEAAHDQLVYTSFEDTSYSIMADILLIKIYYATQHELLGSRVRALEQKVRRSKLVAIRKESYLNFLKTMYKVMKYEPLSSSKQWRKLHDYVKSTTPMVAREWLLREVFN